MSSRCRPVRCAGGLRDRPRARPRRPSPRPRARPRSASDRRRAGPADRPGSSRSRRAAGRGRCRTGGRPAAAGHRAGGWPLRRRRRAAPRATTTARSRSTDWLARRGVDPRCRTARRRPARRWRARRRGSARRGGRAPRSIAGWSSPTRPTSEPPARTCAARPGCRFGSSVSGVYVGVGKPRRSADGLDDALGVVEVVRPAPDGSRPGRSAAPVSAKPEPPPLVGRWLAGRPVALADLEDGDVVGPVPQVGRDDLEQAADQALAQDRVLARQRVGDRDRPAARALLGLAVERPVVMGREPLDHPRARPGRSVTTSVSPAPTSVSRTALRIASGSCR